jgi:hypothetical protein
MEAFESFVAVALETEGFVVSEAVKFPVKRKTGKVAYAEEQTHGYEVDLVAARNCRLVLATVKSYFGSRGVAADHVMGSPTSDNGRRLYLLLHEPAIRDGVVRAACEQYGYNIDQVEIRLYVGKFAAPKQGAHEKRIRAWAASQHVGAGPIVVQGLGDVVARVQSAAAHSQYRDNPVLVTMKVLEAAGLLNLRLPGAIG